MGKKGSWFSAIKRAFTHNNSKDKPSYLQRSDKKSNKEKKTSKGIFGDGETKSFISRFREPSSIEKILGEADELLIRPLSDEPKTPRASLWRPPSPITAASPGPVSPKAVPQSYNKIRYVQRPEPTLQNHHRSATMIQAAFRAYLARRNFRALRGLMRLQGMVRGQNAKRQTINTMKQMQLLVRVQTQIQSRRIQMLENQALQRQAHKNNFENTLSKWNLNQLPSLSTLFQPEAGNNEDWDASVLTKEEAEARLRKKVEAVMKKERAMAYAYSHQLWKATPKSAQGHVDIRSNGYPWWWNWLDLQLPPKPTSQSTKNVVSTPPRPVSEYYPSPMPSTSNHEAVRAKQVATPTPSVNTSAMAKPSKPRANRAYEYPLKDDDSLTSCPPFSVPNYMTPTASAKAKVKPNSNPKERIQGTPVNDSKRRFSFSLTTNMGSFKWNKGSGKDSANLKALEKHLSSHSFGDLSIDSTVSMPARVGRKPFNRFV